MAKDILVAKAFQSTDKDTKEPQVIQTRGGEMHKYMVQFEGRSDWIGILKKPGNEVKAGDKLYGNLIEDGQWGKPEFKGEQRPFGETPQAQKSQPVVKASGELEEKVDYLISLVENFLESQKGTAGTQSTTVNDTPPINLDELNY